MVRTGQLDNRPAAGRPDRSPSRWHPSVYLHALALVWKASPRLAVLSIIVRAVTGATGGAYLFTAQQALTAGMSDGSAPNLRQIVPAVAVLIGLITVVPLVGAVAREIDQLLTAEVERAAEDAILAVASTVEVAAYDDPAFHDRLLRGSTSAQTQPIQVTEGLLSLVTSISGVLAVGASLMVIGPWLPFVMLLAAVPLIVSATRSAHLDHAFAWQMTEAERERAYLFELLTSAKAAKELRAFGLAGHFRDRHNRLFAAHLAALRRTTRRQTWLALRGAALSSAVLAATIAVLLGLALAGRLTLVQAGVSVIAVVLFSQRVFGGVLGASALYGSARFLDDMTSFLALAPSSGAVSRDTARRPFSHLAVRDVWFRYPSSDRHVLCGVSLDINAGDVVALVGANGSGKTTLARLLSQLYVPSSGCIRWDGVDTRTLDRDTLRRSIAVVFQDFLRYSLSARDNVAVGDSSRSGQLSEIRQAAATAGVSHTIGRLPDGFETVLAPEFPGGTDLSGGQWQRMALARAFFRDAPFLILDEPTAALDPDAERALFELVRRLARGRTVLLISHRLASVRSADQIVVLDQGRIVEAGTHDELVERRGRYARMFELQASAYR